MTEMNTDGYLTIAQRLSAWATDRQSPSTELAHHRTIASLLDTTACMIAGSKSETADMALRTARTIYCDGPCSLFGMPEKFNASGAAMVNGACAHALDFDDYFLPGLTHASSVLWASLIAVGTERAVTGRQLLDAFVIGLELHGRIGRLINPLHYNLGWHATSTVGTIATAGAVSLLKGGDAAQICNAMSIAFNSAAGSRLQFGTSTKTMHVGVAAERAVMSASLAAVGVEGAVEFLEDRWGFLNLYGGFSAEPSQVVAGLDDLGYEWDIENNRLKMKRFPCGASAHKVLDSLEAMCRELRLRPEQLQLVVADLPELLYQNISFDRPKDVFEARLSFTYQAARMVKDGCLRLRHFTEEAIREPEVVAMLPLFERQMVRNGGPEDPVRLKVVLKDGKVIERLIKVSRGDNEDPFTREEINVKIDDCLDWPGLSGLRRRFDAIENIGEAKDIGPVFEGLHA